VKEDAELAPVEVFALQKRGGRSGGYPAYTPAKSNQGWHEEWFYIKNRSICCSRCSSEHI
jgi:hypothetical protein